MIKSLGLVVTPAPGTPVQVITTRFGAQTIKCTARKGNTGLVFIGGKGMNKTSGANVFGVVGIPPATGQWPDLTFTAQVMANTFEASAFYVDADQANDGVYVTVVQG